MKTVIFDMDGLMIDSERMIHEAMIYVGETLGVEEIDRVSLETIGSNAIRTKQIYLERYGQDFPFEEAMRLKHKYLDHIIYNEGFPAKKGLYNLLDFLEKNKFKTAVASSTRKEAVYMALEKINVLHRFNAVVCGDMVTNSKPNPEIFLKACQMTNSEPSECYVLEDSFNGIKAGYSAGMKTIMVPDMLQPDESIMYAIWKIAENLDEVIEIIENDMKGKA